MQIEYIGKKKLNNIRYIISELNSKNIIIFTGKSSFLKIKNDFLNQIECDFEIYNKFSVNPKLVDIELFLSNNDLLKYDLFVAIGGGSVIDFAKLCKFFSKSDTKLIAIPTTAGTGSEATQFASYYEFGKKASIDDFKILPNYVILDSTLLINSPKYLKACSAIDAYCQAIESFWAVNSNIFSKEYAKESIILCKNFIKDYVLNNESKSQIKMQLAANLSGKAINISRTTAAHALSYKITNDYNIPHGHAVALSMPDLFECNLKINDKSCIDMRGVNYVLTTMKELIKILQIDNFRDYWYDLLNLIGLEWRFDVLGITDKDSLINSVNVQRLKNNPKDLTEDLQNFWQ